MNENIAQQIADLLNYRNNLLTQYSREKILKYHQQYIYDLDGESLIACVRIKKIQWYQSELRHLAVHPAYEKRGYGQRMISLAEARAKELRTRIVQCTIRADNHLATNAFKRAGYSLLNSFYYPKSSHNLCIWQKTISTQRLPVSYFEYTGE